MKKLLLGIIAILFSFNSWADEIILECVNQRNSSNKITIQINKKRNTFIVDGRLHKLETTKDEYKAGTPLVLSYKINRISKELTLIAMAKVGRYNCNQTERI